MGHEATRGYQMVGEASLFEQLYLNVNMMSLTKAELRFEWYGIKIIEELEDLDCNYLDNNSPWAYLIKGKFYIFNFLGFLL